MAPKHLHLLRYSWQGSPMLESSSVPLQAGKIVPTSDVLQKTLRDGSPELVLCLTMGGYERYVLIREIDDELEKLCDFWKGYLLNKQAKETCDKIEEIREALRKHLRANLRSVA